MLLTGAQAFSQDPPCSDLTIIEDPADISCRVYGANDLFDTNFYTWSIDPDYLATFPPGCL